MHGSEDTGPAPAPEEHGADPAGRLGEPDDCAESPVDGGGDAEREPPLRVYTRAECREVDRRCTEDYGIPSILLMENAALGIATVVRNLLDDSGSRGDGVGGGVGGGVLVFAGPGNNGGDGLAAARHLANGGIPVAIVLAVAPDRYKGDALTNLTIAQRMGLPIFSAAGEGGGGGGGGGEPIARAVDNALVRLASAPTLVLDAVLGTGADRTAAGVLAELIERINEFGKAGVPVVAVDVPSGLDADSGSPLSGPDGRLGPAVRADVTVALLGVKPGYLTLAAQEFVGDCLVAEIGAPRDLIEQLGLPLHDQDEPGEGRPHRRGRGDRDAPDPDRPIDESGGGGAGQARAGGRGRHRAGRRRPG